MPDPQFDNPADLVNAWFAAAADANVRDAIEAVHQRIEKEVQTHTPRCEQSGRCCHFEAYGHRLYVTGLEAALTVIGARNSLLADKPAPQGPTGAGHSGADTSVDCPFQINTTCGVHADRPSGCRVYFCDPVWAPRMNDVAEMAVAAMRAIHERFAIPYRYMEWRAGLAEALG